MQRRSSSAFARAVVPDPGRVRTLGAAAGFGWLDARLWRDGWLEVMTAEDVAVYVFLCLVGDRQGVSWYRQDRIRATLAMDEQALWRALGRLEALGLVAYRPFHAHAIDGYRQVLAVPPGGPVPASLVAGHGDEP